MDSISFIEHVSFDAFHEGNRFMDTIFKAQRLTKSKTRLAGADAICCQQKQEVRYQLYEKHCKQLEKAITKERASRLEGSFGKEKEHYHLKKIRARTKSTETLCIHTRNASEIGNSIALASMERAAWLFRSEPKTNRISLA